MGEARTTRERETMRRIWLGAPRADYRHSVIVLHTPWGPRWTDHESNALFSKGKESLLTQKGLRHRETKRREVPEGCDEDREGNGDRKNLTRKSESTNCIWTEIKKEDHSAVLHTSSQGKPERRSQGPLLFVCLVSIFQMIQVCQHSISKLRQTSVCD